jgi:ABC-2 type transport system ATP-binding protein
MIEAKGLTKYFGQNPAIKEVSFYIEKGEIVGFLGPNGAGKTTTMRIISCFFPPTEGKAKVAGFDVVEDSLEVRKRVGYLPENVPLYTDQEVRTYLNFVAEVKGIPRQFRKSKVEKVMEACGIEDVADKLIGRLSKGYRQRVGIAQALLNDPEVLILDEPTIGLDPKQITEIRRLIKDLAGERTIILSTHILPEVSMICGRTLIINEGRIVAADTPENLTNQLQKEIRIEMEIEGPRDEILNGLRSIPGVTRVGYDEGRRGGNVNSFLIDTKKDLDIRKEIAAYVVTRNWGLLGMKITRLSLEDIFLKLVTEEKGE